MKRLLESRPGFCLFALASILGLVPIFLVESDVLPNGFTQLGALSASFAGVILAGIEGGRAGVRELLGRGLRWRAGAAWWIAAFGYTGVIAVVVLLVAPVIDDSIVVDWNTLGPIVQVVPMMIVLTILAGLGEEFGWRGYLLPRLQRRRTALVASLIVGGFHSLWHVPLFFVEGTVQHAWAGEVGLGVAFLGYSLFVVAWAVQLTWFFNNSGGSVLMVAVVHGAGNAWIGGYLDISGQTGMVGNVCLAVLMAFVSAAVVLVGGATHLSRGGTRDILAGD